MANIENKNIPQKISGYPSYTGQEIKHTLQKLCAPVFDFFKKDESENAVSNIDENYQERLLIEENKLSMFKEILDNADPASKARINIEL